MTEVSAQVILYTTRFCPYCINAKRLLQRKGVDYREIPVDGDPDRRAEMAARSGRRTVPQIWIDERHIGGFDELATLDRQGSLDSLLKLAH